MTIEQNELVAAASMFITNYKSLAEARQQSKLTVFLSHSHKDRDMALGLKKLLLRDLDIYLDWQDDEMPSTPNRDTADRIKFKIREYERFAFLATDNSVNSRWCPWEIGYADAVKGYGGVMIVPTKSHGSIQGSEYLDLYKRIDWSTYDNAWGRRLVIIQP